MTIIHATTAATHVKEQGGRIHETRYMLPILPCKNQGLALHEECDDGMIHDICHGCFDGEMLIRMKLDILESDHNCWYGWECRNYKSNSTTVSKRIPGCRNIKAWGKWYQRKMDPIIVSTAFGKNCDHCKVWAICIETMLAQAIVIHAIR